MAKAAAVQFSCSECGYATGKWLGRCPSCGSWSSLVEERAAPASPGGAAGTARPLLRLVEVEAAEADRIPTGVPELDRVLGGGLVPASLVLVGGEPGVGKSTLLLMALAAISKTRRALLVTGEESTAQVKLRAGRLGGAERVEILAETELDAVCLVGHVTKDGAVAGPRVLEHLVDCVLQFEGDRYRAHRVLRAAKNRFGSTNELGVLELTGPGLVAV